MAVCPDCGLSISDPQGNTPQSKAPLVCLECLKVATPEPVTGWPVVARWVSANRGRGVFAKEDLIKGDLVERCWIMPLSQEESITSLQMPVLNRYLFPWVDKRRVIISGAGLLYNFDRGDVTGREANLECVLRCGISAIEFRALRNIREGEELTWDYQKARSKTR